MGKYKSYIFGLILSLVIFAASLTAFLVLSNRTKNGEIDFKDIPTNQRENIKVANKSYQLNGLDIFQQDFNYYDLYITFLMRMMTYTKMLLFIFQRWQKT